MSRNYSSDEPSVTEVIGILEKSGLHEWYDWLGDEKCKEVAKKSAVYGNKIHDAIKCYLAGKQLVKEEGLDYWPFETITEWINSNISPSEILMIDPPDGLYSKKYKFWGTPDLVCSGFIADWKTDSTPKDNTSERERVVKYALQLTGYAILIEESSGAWINKGIIVRANRKKDFKVIEFNNLKKWKSFFVSLRRLYKEYRGK